MIVFITSIKHPACSKSYQRVWELLNNTLNSICNQKNKDFKVVVVCNSMLPLKKKRKKILTVTEFVTVNFPPVSQIGMQGLRIDKGAKYAIGLGACRKYNPDYVMFFDADDYVGNDISEYVNMQPNQNGWIMSKGYILLDKKLKKRDSRYSICGTGNIFNYNLICSRIFFDFNPSSSRNKIIKSIDKDYLNFILGSHLFARDYFEKLLKPLKDFPYRSVIRHLGTKENYSDYIKSTASMRKDLANQPKEWLKITKEQKAYFNIT